MAKKVILAQMQQRRDSAANWAASNPVLLDGEMGIVTDDPNLYKIGDGVTAWNDLKLRGFDGTLAQTTGDSENAVMSQKAVTAKLTELESEVQDIRGINLSASFSPARASLQRIATFDIVKGETYHIAINLSAAESGGDVYFGLRNAQNDTTLKSLKVLVAGKTSLEQSVVFDNDYKDAFLYVSYYHEPSSEQVISVIIKSNPEFADFAEMEDLKASVKNVETTIDIVEPLSNEALIGNAIINPLGVIIPIIQSISLVKGFVYRIKYQANGGAFSSCALRIRHNDSDVWIRNPYDLESAEYEFTPEENYDGAMVGFIAYGGGSSYGESVSVSFNLSSSLSKGVVELKGNVEELLPLRILKGYNVTYDAYTPIQGGSQILGVCDLVKGPKYRVLIKLAKSESDIVFCGVTTADGGTITGSVFIQPGTLEQTIDIIPEQNYANAKIYVSFYHAPQQGQSITSSITLDSIYDLIHKNENANLDSFEVRTIEQRVLASHLGFGREATWEGDYMPAGWIPQLVFLHISDTHQNETCSKNAITALNLLSTRGLNKGNNARFLIHTGDIKTENYLSDFTYWQKARANANKPVFHVIGNHDCGLGYEVATSGTDEQVFASNIEPYLAEWDLATTNDGTPHIDGKSYYFKDFADEKVRLIVINEYETDFEIDANDATRLKYSRVNRAFRQSQIDWLIDSLLTTPAGWGIMIAKHQMEYADDNDNAFNSYFLRGKREQFTYVGDILPDIVQAFIDKLAISKSYQQTGAVVTTLKAEADFSNNGAEFICYLSGHTHLDSIHYLRDYPKQLELTIGCDNTNHTHNSDMAQVAGTKTEDVINVCSVDRNRGYVYVVRIGADMSYTCQRRDILAIKYRDIV